jgi:hypothetical protein
LKLEAGSFLRHDRRIVSVAVVASTVGGRSLPGYAWMGVLVMAASEAGMAAGLEPFASWHTPIAWTGYILLADGLVWKRRGHSWIRDARPEFLFLAAVSIPLWMIFEGYNKYFIWNWYYVGLPDLLAVRYLGYAWAFATIWPGIFLTAELVSSWRQRDVPRARLAPAPPHQLTMGPRLSIAAGAAMLLLPIVHPSAYLAAPVWLGFIFLLDPINARAGDESILGDWRQGRSDRLVNLLVAGLICGLLWEFWNYWARAKWIYTVPILPDIQLFEMPILGFGGFPAFAVECFVMYVAVRRWVWNRWVWNGGRRPIAV